MEDLMQYINQLIAETEEQKEYHSKAIQQNADIYIQALKDVLAYIENH